MTIIVHHLNNSRSQRILWLLEELGVDYTIQHHQRDAVTNLAPPELLAVHPLGKSPMIDDGGQIVYESAAICEYLCERHGGEHLVPARGTDDHVRYLEYMHFAEGSAMTPILLNLYTSRLGEAASPLAPRISQQMESHFAFMEAQLNEHGHYIGKSLTAADIMMSFPAEIAVMQGLAADKPKLTAFVKWCHAQLAWQRAREKGGAYYGY